MEKVEGRRILRRRWEKENSVRFLRWRLLLALQDMTNQAINLPYPNPRRQSRKERAQGQATKTTEVAMRRARELKAVQFHPRCLRRLWLFLRLCSRRRRFRGPFRRVHFRHLRQLLFLVSRHTSLRFPCHCGVTPRAGKDRGEAVQGRRMSNDGVVAIEGICQVATPRP